MRGLIVLSVLTVILSAASCKARDRCGDCPTFSGVEQIDKEQA